MTHRPATTLADKMSLLMARNSRPIRFAAAGAMNTAFGLAIYPILLRSSDTLHRHYLVALGIAQVTSLCFAFGMYKWRVFRTRANLIREFWTFASFYLFIYALNWIALPVLVEAAGVAPIIAQFFFSLVLMVGSYFWHSRITFRPKREP